MIGGGGAKTSGEDTLPLLSLSSIFLDCIGLIFRKWLGIYAAEEGAAFLPFAVFLSSLNERKLIW